MNEAFSWQSAGQSTIASALFEEGFKKASEKGEDPRKLQLIRQLFVWYRTYGRYLGLMEPPVHDYDKIHGEFRGRSNSLKLLSYSQGLAQRDKRKREYLFAVSEIITGFLGVWLVPIPVVKGAGYSAMADGGLRIWNIFQEVAYERDEAKY